MKILLAIIVMLNGKPIEFKDAKPFMQGKGLMVPLREVSQEMKVTASYSKLSFSKQKSVVVGFQRWGRKRNLIMWLGSRRASISRAYSRAELLQARIGFEKPTPVLLDAPPQLKNGRVFVPLRFVENLGNKVAWDGAKQTANIVKKPIEKPQVKLGEKPSTPGKAAPIEAKLSTDKRDYRVGETVKFTLTARNISDKDQVLKFSSSQNFDISATPTEQYLLTLPWDWSHDQMFTQSLREVTIKPGKVLTFSVAWDQSNNSDQQIARGDYGVEAKIIAQDNIIAPIIGIRLIY